MTQQSLLDELQVGLQVIARDLGRLVGPDRSAPLAGVNPDDLEGDVEHRPLASPARLPIADILSAAYDFAIDGRLTMFLADELEDLAEWEALLRGLRHAVDWDPAAHDIFASSLKVLRQARLRPLLSGAAILSHRGLVVNHVHLGELAELAELDEKTVRNMASPQYRPRLPTVKIDKRTYVSLNVAIPWLEARGFKPTVLVETPADRDFDTYPFYSRADLAHFLTAQRTRLGISTAELAARIPEEPDAVGQLEKLEAGAVAPTEPFAARLAPLLGITHRSFAKYAAELGQAFYDALAKRAGV